MFWHGAKQGDVLDTASDDDDNFDLTPAHAPSGQQRFIKSRMQHYLRRQFVDVDPDGRRAIATAYPKHLVKTGSSQAATILIRDDVSPILKRGDALLLDYDTPDMDITNTQWDYLVDRANHRDFEEMPTPDDSHSLESYSASLLAEMEAERQEADDTKSNTLSPMDVDIAIDTAIEAYEEKWHNEKLPKREEKARSVWIRAQGRRLVSIEDATRREVERLGALLTKLRKAIHDEVWTKSSQVIKQCKVMEITVYNIQDASWKLKLWKQPLCPAKVSSKRVMPRKKPVPTQGDAEDEESLDSDTSAPSEEEQLEDFIDIDQVPIPAAPQYHQPRRSSFISIDSDLEPIDSTEIVESTEHQTELNLEDIHPGRDHSTYNKSSSPSDGNRSPAPRSSRSAYDGFDALPEDADDEQIRNWTWQTLHERNDRKRIILKIMLSMDSFQRQQLITHMFFHSQIDNVKHSTEMGIRLIQANALQSPAQAKTVRVHMARLFICWMTAHSRYWYDTINDPGILEQSLLGLKSDFDLFHAFVGALRSRFDALSDTDDVDDGGELMAIETPGKRKRKIKESKRGKNLRADAAARREEDELQMQKNIVELHTSQGGVDDIKTAVNPGKKDDEQFIFISNSIASRIKDHQLDGVRFMWREITAEGDAAQGCLLAHTMGLGKTMQTITVLATVAEAAASPALREQLPQALRDPKFLILCPPGLVGNWMAEFHQWVQPGSAIKSPLTLADVPAHGRTHIVERWHTQKSGVLLLGYDMFRGMILNKASTKSGQTPYLPSDHDLLLKWLLDGPSIVVADEAHKMKNQATGVGITTKKFKTPRRIALTGSPLANNLMEYYAMIDWVAPDFLGDREEFSNFYQLPIERSTNKDSTKYEQRTGLKKLKLLRTAIRDKISRADITVLKDSLPPKTEFVLHVALTPVQKDLYSEVYEATKRHEKVETASIFGFIAFLRILCTHPSAFAKKLLTDSKQSKSRPSENEEDGATAVRSQLNDALSEKARAILAQPDHDALVLSNKMIIIMRILDLARSANESVLLFSQSLDILDYIESILGKTGVRYRRLDGSTKMTGRQGLAKAFNDREFDVFLIATRAGGLGLNMPAATRVILVDFSFDPTVEEQAVGRAYRIGQSKPVFVYHLVAGGTFEVPLHHLTIFKKQLASRTIDHKTPSRAGMKMKDYIFSPQEVEPLSRAEFDAFRGKDGIMDNILEDDAISKCICGISTAETLHVDVPEPLTAEEEGEVAKWIELESLRQRDPIAYQRRKDAEILHPDSVYNSNLELQTRLLAESAARLDGSLPASSAHLATAAEVLLTQTAIQPAEQAQTPQLQPPQVTESLRSPLQRTPASTPRSPSGLPQSSKVKPFASVWHYILGPMIHQPAVIRLRTENPDLGQEQICIARRILIDRPSVQTDWESFKIIFDAAVAKKRADQSFTSTSSHRLARQVSPTALKRISDILGPAHSTSESARRLAAEHPDASRTELLAAKTILDSAPTSRANYGAFERQWKELCRTYAAQVSAPAQTGARSASSAADAAAAETDVDSLMRQPKLPGAK